MDDAKANDGAVPGDIAPASRPWTAHYSSSVPASITVPEQPLTWLLDEAARTSSAFTAIEYYGTRLSYAQFASLADRFARGLVKLGVRPGDRVSICLPNCPQFPVAFYGRAEGGRGRRAYQPAVYTARVGAPTPRFRREGDRAARPALPQPGASAREYPGRAYHPDQRRGLLPAAARAGVPRARGDHVTPSRPQAGAHSAQRLHASHDFRHFIGHAGDSQRLEGVQLPESAKPDDLALLQYTGGTTGVAKGAMLTHRNLLTNAMQCWSWNEQPAGSKHVTLCVAPFFHVYGLTVAMNLTIFAASTMVLLPRFTVKDTLDAIEKYKPDLFPGVPTMYLALAREVEQHPRDLRSIQVCISGSAPLPARGAAALRGGLRREGGRGLRPDGSVARSRTATRSMVSGVWGRSACRCPTPTP